MTDESPVRILIARSPHPAESSAEEFAAWIARTSPATIRTVTVLPSIWPSDTPDGLGEDYQHWIRKETKNCERAALQALKNARVPDDSLDTHPFEFITATSET
ncbi:universal stress protein, partial [Klebsiella pneumoniae]